MTPSAPLVVGSLAPLLAPPLRSATPRISREPPAMTSSLSNFPRLTIDPA
jgi:hypothetical protein